jgi:hypothetical protein
MGSYHRDGIIPYHTIGIIPYHTNGIIPWRWNHTIEMESYHMESYHRNGIIPKIQNHTIIPSHRKGTIPHQTSYHSKVSIYLYHNIFNLVYHPTSALAICKTLTLPPSPSPYSAIKVQPHSIPSFHSTTITRHLSHATFALAVCVTL